ncbi:D-alanyl-D-alanine carboxypeptidase family protein [Dichelobacter nodosus]|uniref:D-alanyl-D-alanine carboxypeptidase family protein n=1 Tax=Dichelobacter nodosus TaxID=870 RepID=UPI00107EA3F6|nr:D-alanyl-D-alanine carboxypeptidase family protein [Dichelobacter nodosus]TGA64544.1 D-alanyl-D-alanine carboxypeptidase [Dichelobacter nodosus]
MLFWKKCCFVTVFLLFFGVRAEVPPPDLPVKSYLLMDAQSGQILAERAADERLPPASITKLMTAYVTFNALKTGKIHLTDLVTISANARAQNGSRMFVEVNSQVSVNDLLQGMIVQSGNDASVALAEYIGGTVAGFVHMMNATAKQLGLQKTHYQNPTGMPDEQHFSTAHDIARLAQALIRDFPEFYHFYQQKEFTWNNIKQPNRNRLLWRNQNVDGLKTGYTDAAGYCLAASEKRGDWRLIGVVLGAEKEAQRYDAAENLLNFGFANYTQVTALRAEQVLLRGKVYKGLEAEVPIVAERTVHLLLPVTTQNAISAHVALDTLIAPIAKGQKVGTITVTDGSKSYATVPALAGKDIAAAGFFKRLKDSFTLWRQK